MWIFSIYFQEGNFEPNSDGKISIDESPRNNGIYMEEALAKTSKFLEQIPNM